MVQSKIIASLALVLLAVGLEGCRTPPNRLVYSSGFSFANYDFLVIGEPDGKVTSTTLYGMDIEFGNLMSRYNMKVVGNKEYETLPLDKQRRTLFVRLSIVATGNDILMSVSFDDAVTGRTCSSITGRSSGDIFNIKERTRAFEILSRTITKALVTEKHLTVAQERR